MSVFKIGINEECNQANHQRQHQGILCPVKIAPTNGEDQSTLRVDDYHLKYAQKKAEPFLILPSLFDIRVE